MFALSDARDYSLWKVRYLEREEKITDQSKREPCENFGRRKLLFVKFMHNYSHTRLRACLHGVGDPGLVGLVSFVVTLWWTQNKRNLPH